MKALLVIPAQAGTQSDKAVVALRRHYDQVLGPGLRRGDEKGVRLAGVTKRGCGLPG